jgi:competence protein ComEC
LVSDSSFYPPFFSAISSRERAAHLKSCNIFNRLIDHNMGVLVSGYHMAVVAGVVFFTVRALLALIPALTVGFPIKKWSAAAALAAAAFYLLLSGAEVATQRSFFMTAVVLIAVMDDRRAVTFRTLAVAAMIVLALAPEALVHPSFQMFGAAF